MAGLQDTIGKLSAKRRGPAPSSRLMRESQDFGANPGALRMLSFVPEGLKDGAPLVVVLHGCTQHAEAFAESGGWLALAQRCGFAVLSPEQSPANNPNLCFNWFRPGDTARGKGEAASIRNMITALKREHRLGEVFVTGLSAGGAMTAVMLAAYPEVFAGGAVIAGLPYGVAGSVQEAMMAMQGQGGPGAAELGPILGRAAPSPKRVPRLSIWHGGADMVVNVGNAQRIAGQWASAHGLAAAPDETRMLFGRSQAIWRAPSGEVAMELNLLPGMGHGSPLATLGPDGLGSPAPFMLETGVSSTLEIARFWGIAPEALAEAPFAGGALAGEVLTREEVAALQRPAEAPGAGAHPIGDGVMAAVSPHVSQGIQATIAKALRAAGLLG